MGFGILVFGILSLRFRVCHFKFVFGVWNFFKFLISAMRFCVWDFEFVFWNWDFKNGVLFWDFEFGLWFLEFLFWDIGLGVLDLGFGFWSFMTLNFEFEIYCL